MLVSLILLTHAIQPAVDAAFANRDGSAVVVTVDTGRVVASRHPNVEARPGSAIKPFVLEALHERGAADPRIACPGRLRIAGKVLDCTHPPLNEPLDAHRALAYSCNNWFAESSRRIGAADLRQTLLRFGFTSVDAAANDDAKRLQAIGEAGVRVTPLEMAAAYRRLARRGDLNQDLAAAAEFGTAQLASPLGEPVAAKTGTTSDGAWLAGWIPADQPKYVVVVFLPAGSGGSDAAPVARQIFAALASDPRGVKVQAGGVVLDLPLEDYVAGVVAGEGGIMRSAESLKAMAVAARTWASALRGRHRENGFDFCSTTHCQEYRPGEVTQAVVAAVRATAGEMLWWEGRPALAYYSRDCGGMTEASEDVWPELKVPYLIRHPDPWCRTQGRNEWRAEIPKTALTQALHTQVSSVHVVARSASGRVARISLGGKTEMGSFFRFEIGRQLGWNLVRSDSFEVTDEASQVVFRGTGSGHGVGMCQTGAAQMGQQGRDYREILAFYYPGAILSRSARGIAWRTLNGERVRVFTSRPDADADLLRHGDALAGRVEARVGLKFRTRPDIRIYPDLASFRDGTGEPGWVAGSTKGREIRLQPGMGEATLRHELTHELVEQNASPGLPWWFQEGLVLCLDGPGTKGSGPLAGDYESARQKVRKLMDTRGERVVLAWITAGLPRELRGPATPTR